MLAEEELYSYQRRAREALVCHYNWDRFANQICECVEMEGPKEPNEKKWSNQREINAKKLQMIAGQERVWRRFEDSIQTLKANLERFINWFNLSAAIFVGLGIRLFLNWRLIGREFDSFGRGISFKFFRKSQFQRFAYLLSNPVSIVRYFEYSFGHKSVNWIEVGKGLDISSPRIFYTFLLKKYPQLKYDIINPNNLDLQETQEFINILGLVERTNLFSMDGTKLKYPDNHFDVVTSLSVIEHIPDNGDILAIKEMWRVLRMGGKLVVTVPCSKSYHEEWKDNDVYGLGKIGNNGKFFFQRVYDSQMLRERVFDTIKIRPVLFEVYGERVKGIYNDYEKRWILRGLRESVKDPWHIVRNFKEYANIEQMPGLGVCGLVFEKK
ncbi:MAG: class I SAM-dependent methyltransferase [Candidatus Helarchaeota archaeon]|nr:class I SAM-dependent methyltransferase [Candidatus Helarchaeota archaeon]